MANSTLTISGKVIALSDVEEHVICEALAHYRHYLKVEQEELTERLRDVNGESDWQNSPELNNVHEWLAICTGLVNRVKAVIFR